MVRILSNGEIVQDNDPRVERRNQANSRQRQGFIRHDDQQQQGQYQQGISLFDNANERLRQAGVPQWNLMQYTVEPIVSVGFLLALLIGGFRGLIFALALFFVCKWSQGGANAVEQTNRAGNNSRGGGGGQGGGYRLGR